jgi:hypothetical protein
MTIKYAVCSWSVELGCSHMAVSVETGIICCSLLRVLHLDSEVSKSDLE